MFVENTAAFFADFGQTVTVGGVAVSALFDNGYSLGSVGAVGMASNQPSLLLASADVPANPIDIVPVVVAGVSYVIGAHEPDGTGISRLLLERG